MKKFTAEELEKNYDFFASGVYTRLRLFSFLDFMYGTEWLDDLIDFDKLEVHRRGNYTYRKISENFCFLDDRYIVRTSKPFLCMDIINRKASCGYFTDAFVYLGDGCFFVRNIAETGITYPSNNDSCIISLHKNSGFFIGDSYYDEYDYKRSRILRDIVEIYIRLEDLYDMKLPLDYDSDKFTKKYLGERISLKVKDDEKYWKVDAAIKFLDVLDNDIMSEKLAIDIDLIKFLRDTN